MRYYTEMKKNGKMKMWLTRLGYVAVFSLFTFHFSLVSAQSTTGVRIGGSVYGGGNKATVSGEVTVTVKAGTVGNNVYGGGNEAAVNGTTAVTLDSVAVVDKSVFGGGNQAGVQAQTDVAGTGSASVTVNGGVVGADETAAAATYGVYGGCNSEGSIEGAVTVNINGGTLGTANKPLLGIFGGGYGSKTSTGSNVTVTIGDFAGTKVPTNLYTDIYGGSALGKVNAAASNTTKVDFLAGTLHGNLYGGGLGLADIYEGEIRTVDNSDKGRVNGKVLVNIGTADQTNCRITLTGCSIYGCNNTNGSPQSDVDVKIYQTAHTETDNATKDNTNIDFAIANVFGGGNHADYTANGTAKISVFSCNNTIERIFGGGNAADATGVAVEVFGGRFDQIFGGGNGENNQIANIGAGGTNTLIHGGYIRQLFGGSNETGEIKGPMRTTIIKDSECPEEIEDFFGGSNKVPIIGDVVTDIVGCDPIFKNVYGGSNEADITGNVILNIRGGQITNVFGGSKGTDTKPANIKRTSSGAKGSVTLNLYGGHVANAYGGSNINGNIENVITVNVLDTSESCALQLENVYGGSNLATYQPYVATLISPVVNIKHVRMGSSITGRIYGGGKGAKSTINDNGTSTGDNIDKGKCVSNPQVNIGDNDPEHYVTIHGNVYGGGALAYVDGNTAVNVQNANPTTVHTVLDSSLFGSGMGYVGDSLAANVTKNATVTITGGRVSKNVYGGGELASVGTFAGTTGNHGIADGTGTTTVTITGGIIGTGNENAREDNANGNVYGAGLGKAGHQKVGDYTYNFSYYNYVKNADVTIADNAVVRGSVFGGGDDGHVWNDTRVKIKGGTIGSPLADSNTVEVEGIGPIIYTGNVYGGGRGVDPADASTHHYSLTAGRVFGNTYVEVSGGMIHHDVYGGGSLASVGDTIASVSTSGPMDIMGNIISGQYEFRKANPADASGYATNKRDYRVGDPVTGTGLAHVRITGGQIGTTGINEGSVFGSGRGMAGAGSEDFVHMAFVHNAQVYIKDTTIVGESESRSDTADIRGSVFGGGANGHVTQNTYVEVDAGTIGAKLSLEERRVDATGMPIHRIYRGNVYGSGRGVDFYEDQSHNNHLSKTAGRVYGNTEVRITGGTIRHSVFGGGSLASVGTYVEDNSVPAARKIHYIEGTGQAKVTMTGGRVGPKAEDLIKLDDGTYIDDLTGSALTDAIAAAGYNGTNKIFHGSTGLDLVDTNFYYLGSNEGCVYGSGRGMAYTVDNNTDYSEMAFTNNTIVDISGSSIVCGSVFGGGENGHVKFDTKVNIHGDARIGGIPLVSHHHNHAEDYDIESDGFWEGDGSHKILLTVASSEDEHAEDANGTGKTVYRGNVYGGGRGVDHAGDPTSASYSSGFSNSAGRVYGNTEVSLSENAQVFHNIFGGGSIASVGTYTLAADGTPLEAQTIYKYNESDYDPATGTITVAQGSAVHTGNAVVTVSGGAVGRTGHNEGFVYGAGRGMAGSRSSQISHLSYCDNTIVTISGTADVRGSVFGGGMNGHVLDSTYVEVSGGFIGARPKQANEVLTTPAEGEVFNNSCLASDGTHYRRGTVEYVSGITSTDTTEVDHYGRATHTSFLGNVYGAGRGVDNYTGSDAHTHLSPTAGRVYGNTHVKITGGYISHNVYGGGSIASVGNYDLVTAEEAAGEYAYLGREAFKALKTGLNESLSGRTWVEISGGQIGDNGINNGLVFGSSRGMAGNLEDVHKDLSYANITHVIISGTSDVRGCVFGSGENGHVLDSTLVEVRGGSIGNGIRTGADSWANNYIGNVYGGGRGVDLTVEKLSSLTAGWVRGSTHVKISGGHVHNNVYGGGSLAAVGIDGRVGYFNTPITTKTGRTWVDVTGGLIGTYVAPTLNTVTGLWEKNAHTSYGNVYGAGRGRAGIGIVHGNDWAICTYVSNSVVRVNYSSDVLPDVMNEPATGTQHIVGNVYGGGNNGHVNNSTDVRITRGRIGSDGDKGFGSTEGNVFGGGRGEDTYEAYLVKDGYYVTNSGQKTSIRYSRTDRSAVKAYYETSRSHDDSLAVVDSLSRTAGLVYGNTNVAINATNASDVQVMHHVYGGGANASVGNYWIANQDYATAHDMEVGDIYLLTEGTGTATVNITGGTFGTVGRNNGMIFGASRGDIGAPGSIYDSLAYVNQTFVTIGTSGQGTANPLISGSVYGGGENGHVVDNSSVAIHSGKIGNHSAMYDRVKAIADKNNPTDEEIAGMNDTLKLLAYCGNVYAGGCGTDKYTDVSDNKEKYNVYAGAVYGNSTIVMDGGYVERNIYGGGAMANLGRKTGTYVEHKDTASTFALSWPVELHCRPGKGHANITISGNARVGYNGMENGNIYGGARGEAGDRYAMALLANVDSTSVTINISTTNYSADPNSDHTTPLVAGSVYGGAENGHVMRGTNVLFQNGLVVGNLFGAGKGTDTYTDRMRNTTTHSWEDASVHDITAGKVYGNTHVMMTGGRVNHNIYGGGNMASVGKGNYNGPYGEGRNITQALKDSAENSGYCYVTITGGIIGSDTSDINRGHIFGAGKGIVFPMSDSLGYDYNRDFYVAYTNKTFITIGDSNNRNTDFVQPHVTGSVFGGGEDGHVRYDTYVKVCSGQIGINCTDSITSDVGNWAYRGNVFGAGRGIDKLPGGGFCQSAGSVTRNTRIDILGGRVYRNVQGGGSMASVGTPAGYSGDPSTCVINVNLPSDNDSLGAAFSKMYAFGGYIGGGSRGIASPNGTDSSDLATCHNTQINLYRGFVRNTIYGGGENGQILGNTEINIYGGRVRSAIYGGGKGSFKAPPSETGDATGNYDNDTLSGYIHGNTTVNLLGGVVPYTYGGGRRASMGGDATINIGKDSLDSDGSYYGNVAFDPKKNSVYGGNQYAGSPRGDINVNVYSTAHGLTPETNRYPNNVSDSASLVANDSIQTYAIGKVYGACYNSHYLPYETGHSATVHIYGCENTIMEVYGGGAAANVGDSAGIGANTNLIIEGGRFKRVFGGGDGSYDRYIGHGVPANIYGTATTKIHSGLITEYFGGSNTAGNITTISTQIDHDTTRCAEVIGNLYTGSNESEIFGDGELTIACGSGYFNEVYGGSNNAVIHGSVTLNIQGGEIGRVFGGSKGRLATDTSTAFAADIDGNVTLNLVGGIIGDAFGGSNINGAIGGIITVNVLDTCQKCPLKVDNVYGAGNITAYTPDSIIIDGVKQTPVSPIVNIKHTRTSNTFTGSVYGGGLGSTAIVTANPRVTIGDNDPDHTALVGAHVFGGGSLGNVVGNTSVLVQNPNTRVTGDIHGGGALANVKSTNVTLNAGTVGGNIYGGGLGRVATNEKPAVAALVDGDVQVTINGGRASTVYGANNINGTPTGTVHVDVYGTDVVEKGYAVASIYGGGNHAAYDSIPYVTIHNCSNEIEYVYGGGNAASVRGTNVTIYGGDTIGNVYGGCYGADVTKYGTQVNIHGGTIGSVFGGNNESGTITGEIQVNVNKQTEPGDDKSSCEMHIARVYGGGNHADSKAGSINIGCTGNRGEGIDTVFGGANQANIDGQIVLNITGGSIGNVFGGNNISGNISGPITVNVNWDNDACTYDSLGNVYGAGNLAEYKPTDTTISSPIVNLFKGTVNGNVYGGGYGIATETKKGLVNANPIVNVGDNTLPDAVVLVKGDVNGGGAMAQVVGSTVVNMNTGTIEGNLFGAGEGIETNPVIALVMKNSTVNMIGGCVKGSVYGGGDVASVGYYNTYENNVLPESCNEGTGHTAVYISSGVVGPDTLMMPTFKGHVFGGGKGRVADPVANAAIANLGYSNTTEVVVSGDAFIKGSVYGGSESGHVFDSTYVKIQGGQIGAGFDYAADTNYSPYTKWDTVSLAECHHWPFKTSNLAYDPYADKYDSKGGAVNATDGHTYYGNVFGGGSGVFPYQPVGRIDTAIWSRTAGAVYGNTRVEVTGGHILTSLYGGNEMTNVGTYDNAGNCIAGGTATVIMTNGTLGVPRTLDSIAAHPVTCYLFGAGKGDPRIFFNTATNIDSAYIHVSGGRIYGSIFGGGEDGHVMRHVSLNVDGDAYIGTEGKSYVDGNIFGAGRGFSGEALTAGTVGGNVTVNIGGNSKMLGNVYGGGRLASVGTLFTAPNDPGYGHMIDGDDHGNVTINISGDAVIGNESVFGNTRPSHLKTGNVYGGSMGCLELPDGAINPIWPGLAKVKNTQINIADNAVICASVFGGGELGTVTGNTEVNITGANVRIGTVKRDANDSILYRFGSLFGGGYGTDDTTTTNDSTRASYLIAGRVYGNTVVNLDEGAIANNVFGGGKMAYIGDEKVASSGNTTVNIGNANQNSNSVIIGNNVFGANDESGSPLGSTTVHIYHTAHNADNSYPTPAPTNASELASNMANQQYSIAAVYGGGNLASHTPADTVNSTTLVYVHYCDNTIRDIYGGGNAADTRNNSVIIDGGRIHRVFGGGNGYSASGNHSDPTAPDYNPGAGALGTATTAIHGGLIDTVFGGSNQYGYINQIEFILDNQRSDGGDACAQVIGGLFGGGNESPGGGGEITIACGAGYFSEVYGGANMATIGTPDAPSDVTLNIQGGRIDKVFGGSKGDTTALGSEHKNLASHIYGNVTVNVTGGELGYVYGGSNYNGNISGIITVNVDSTQSSCPLTIANNVYGASYITMYKPNNRDVRSPVVNIKHGTVGGNVFGGGDGQGARTCSNPTVNIGNGDYTTALSDPNAPTATARIIDVKPVVKGNVYGGGNAARVLGNTLVEMLDGIVDGSLYAACKGKPYAELAGDAEKETRAIVDGWTTLNLKGGLVKDCLYGGGELGQVGHLENNSLSKYDTEADTIKAKYGNTYITMTGGTVGAEGAAATHGNVYGGGQGNTESPLTGRVQGNTSVKISSGHVRHNVYGGGSLASVGTLTYGGALSIVSDVKPGTGTATLYITGGTIGTTGVENGIIFGSSRGDIDTIGSRQDTLAWVGNTIVTIGDTTAPHNMNAPQIKGSIYGGGENGHVHRDAYVHVYSGQVGYQNATNPALDENDPNYPYRGNVYGAGCGTDTYMDVVRDIANGNTIIKSKADPTKDSIAPHYNVHAGVVHGNTHVVVSGGHIMHNVYGGGAMGSVGTLNSVLTYHTDEATQFALSWPVVLDYADGTGTARVDIKGGRIGTIGSFDGDIFGGARGEAGDRYQMARYANVKNTVVNINFEGDTATFAQALSATDTTPCVTGSVHGGAENGHVYTDAHVTLARGLVGHALYGGGSGKGKYTASLRKRDGSADSTASVYSLTAGRVYGNTYVTMTGGQVGRSVYGGGNQGSVGKGNYAGGPGDYSLDGYGERWNATDDPLIASLANSGHTYVTITGGTLGRADVLYKSLPTGNVFGGCRGTAAPNVPPTLSPRILYCPEFFLGYVNHTHVVIGDSVSGPVILGSVYGGGMDGHVRMDANVLVKGGEIGLAYDDANHATVGTSDLSSPHWLARGCVFGAGSGNGTYTDNTGDHQSNSAGSVTQFTTVDIEGGTVHNAVYGGGLLSTVGQPRIRKTYDAPLDSTLSLVVVKGGTVGDATSTAAGYGGDVFGGSRGDIDVDTNFAKVIYARVDVQNNANILGNVYGGGELGIVKQDAWVNVSKGTVDGSLFGGGKGDTADRDRACVHGNTSVDMRGGSVKGSVYGGGELASVGTFSLTFNNAEPKVATAISCAAGTGTTSVTITGGTIGESALYMGENIGDDPDADADHTAIAEYYKDSVPGNTERGHVFGAGKGITGDATLCNVNNTHVTIGTVDGDASDLRIYGSVYGGSAKGHVTGSTAVAVHSGTVGTVGVSSWDGNIFGGGEGGGYLDDEEEFILYPTCGRVAGNTSVTMDGGRLKGTIYGGGRLALTGVDVDGSLFMDANDNTQYDFTSHGLATVSVSGTAVIGMGANDNEAKTGLASDYSVGDIFGSGRGDVDYYSDVLAGRVANTSVTVSGTPTVYGAVFGGGEMAGIGWWTDAEGHPFVSQTGTSQVTISGGTIGTPYEYGTTYLTAAGDNPDDWTVIDIYKNKVSDTTFKGRLFHACTGNIIGASQGDVDTEAPHWISMGRSRQSSVDITGGTIMGNVYGGAEQGVVMENTHVTVSGGEIGTLIPAFTFLDSNGVQVVCDAHYFGSVFGGGYGSERWGGDQWPTPFDNDSSASPSLIAGRTYGNTYVTISGDATIHENVYGGGNMASVGYVEKVNGSYALNDTTKCHNGLCTVIITGGTIGPHDHTLMNGHVYGAGKGVGYDPDEHFKTYCNVTSTNLTVNGGHIYGSTFGGGADCHVLGSTHTYIQPGAYIGSDEYTEEYDGCVIGGGRNALNVNHTAGRVLCHTHVTVTGGRIERSVIGGGALARTGVDVDGLVASFVDGGVYDSIHYGSTFVNVSGTTDTIDFADYAPATIHRLYDGTIDTFTVAGVKKAVLFHTTIGAPDGSILVDNDYTIGDIFGGGKGDTKDTVDIMAGRVMNTYVHVYGTPRIMADVYAGAEMASVGWWDTNRYVGIYGSSAKNANHDKYYSKTGYTHVVIDGNPYTGTPYEFSSGNIHGGRPWTLIDSLGRLYHTCSGNLYGGGQGYVEEDATHRWNWVHMGRVRNTSVIVNGGRFMGNAFGGGSRGVVKEDCHVTITGGRFGTIIHDKPARFNQPYYYYGSVFGGGYGNHKRFSHINDSSFVTTGGDIIPMVPTEQAGRVYGNTYVNITGGHIMDCIYGGGDMASTGWVERDSTTGNFLFDDATKRHGGICNVSVSGNTIVGPLDYNGHNGYVYAAGRGIGYDSIEYSKTFCNVNEAHLTVNLREGPSADPTKGPDQWDTTTMGGRIWGSLFGGGADSHVLDSVSVVVHSGVIGTDGTTSFDGNIFGGGRNYLHTNTTNGRVAGNIRIFVDRGTLRGSIFGGGRMAQSGVDVDGNFPASNWDTTSHGNVTIVVTGTKSGDTYLTSIGNPNSEQLLTTWESNGDIFGSGKGDTKIPYTEKDAGRVTNATVTVSGSPRLYGSVFGGGEMASLGYWDNSSVFIPGTGIAVINISGSPVIGSPDEINLYHKPVDPENPDAAAGENPGDWTIYDEAGNLTHTCTGNIYGGCQGDVDLSSPAWVSMARSYSSSINITGTPTIMSTVSGGSEQGTVYGNTRVVINMDDGGSIGTLIENASLPNNGTYFGNIYGGGYGIDEASDTAATYTDALGTHDVTNDSTGHRTHWRADYIAGRVFGNTQVDILGGLINGSVYGGGERAYVGEDESSTVNGRTLVNIGSPTSGNAVIRGDVFGANNFSGTPFGNTEVNIYHMAHNATNSYPDTSELKTLAVSVNELTGADLAEQTQQGLQGYALHAAYGGGNKAAHMPVDTMGTTNVHIYFCDENTVETVYGGGNAAATRNNNVIVDGGRIYRVFGGGNGYSETGNHDNPDEPNYNPGADVLGRAITRVHAGLIDQVYGGSNQLGNIGHVDLTVNHDSDCPEVINESFGGGNEAPGGGGEIVIDCGTFLDNFYAGANAARLGSFDHPVKVTVDIRGGNIGNFFGGCKGTEDTPADIYGDVVVNYYGGRIVNLFGGSDVNGNISGTITVNVDVYPDFCKCADGLQLDRIYGGGRDAAYTPYDPFRGSPTVNIKNNRYRSGDDRADHQYTAADSSWIDISAVFGGGLGSTAVCTSYPRVVVGGFPDTTCVEDGQTISYKRFARIHGNVYGGGEAAPVVGNTLVIIRNATIGEDINDVTLNSGMVYGGGLGATAKITGETFVGIYGQSDIKNNVYGGGNAGIVTGSTELQLAYQQQVFPPEFIAFLDADDGGKLKGKFVCTTPDVRFSYTRDGSEPPVPATEATLWDSVPFEFGWNDTVQCIAYLWDDANNKIDSSMIPSLTAFDKATMPIISIDGNNVTLNGSVGARIRYTLDGSEPTHESTIYGNIGETPEAGATGPFTIAETQVVRAISEMRGCYTSSVSSLVCDAPTVTIEGTTCTITGPAGSTLTYTTDLSTPVSNMAGATRHGTYVNSNTVTFTIPSGNDLTIKAVAQKPGYLPSLIGAAVYRP